MGSSRADGVRSHHSISMTSRAEEVRRLFDLKAPTWGAKYDARGALAKRSLRFVVAVAEHRPPPADLLDYGCGSGDIARALHRVGYSVVGCDISPGMLRMARKIGSESPSAISWINLDATAPRLPFADRSFDVIIASSVLEYLSDPLTTLRQLRRVVRDDGCLFCTVPNVTQGVRRLEAILQCAATRPAERITHLVSTRVSNYISYLRLSRNRLHVEEWKRLAREAGFAGVWSEGSGGSLLMLRLTPNPTN
jgi:ubiquinone/menaquinone biosynthesis C-methylase UbiE